MLLAVGFEVTWCLPDVFFLLPVLLVPEEVDLLLLAELFPVLFVVEADFPLADCVLAVAELALAVCAPPPTVPPKARTGGNRHCNLKSRPALQHRLVLRKTHTSTLSWLSACCVTGGSKVESAQVRLRVRLPPHRSGEDPASGSSLFRRVRRGDQTGKKRPLFQSPEKKRRHHELERIHRP